ncbi:ankyrin repeat domain-containing protein [Aeromicrobium sp. YIM 150415]|uniref:ankyrin repeat domain-containing protein n=1 Tax=Aeromicrobium sp. YIM 150415 TaxID=2803912 RepID=UPI001962334D|nr:ankyrin repeat domain-containing protein [Aeromicrobium sp. YIM 150415]MBM9464485.1 ankyrin repeat domain-containing protein [Aeromicrobium sp. YIM 150415]
MRSSVSFPLLTLALGALLAACADTTPAAVPPAETIPSVSPAPAEELSQEDLDTALIEATWANDVPAVTDLIERGADVDHQDETQQSSFLIAASEGHLDILRLALDAGADVTALDSFEGTALIRAAERGHANVVGDLVRAGVDLDHVNNLGYQAIHEAAWLGRDDADYATTVRVLIAAGATVDRRSDRQGLTPAQLAGQRGFTGLAGVFEATTAPVAEGDAKATLLRAAADGDADLVARALRAGADIEARGEDGRTALLHASIGDHVAAARVLVALGADPDVLDDRHDTAWLVTGVTGSVEMLETLLPAEPDLTIVNRFGGVSVIPASERGHVDYVRRVVQTGIDVDHMNQLGWTALLEAVILGDGGEAHQQIVDILLEAGADPSITDNDGMTALAHAEQRGYDQIATSLRAAAAG